MYPFRSSTVSRISLGGSEYSIAGSQAHAENKSMLMITAVPTNSDKMAWGRELPLKRD